MTELTDHQLERYARNVILDEVGEDGQLKLLAAKVLVVVAETEEADWFAAEAVVVVSVVDTGDIQRQEVAVGNEA